MIVYLSGVALQTEIGVVIRPADAPADDPTSWLPLREVLEKLQACRSKHKLLVFEWTPPPAIDRVGYVYHDIAAALPGELEAVPDADRLVFSACSSGQQPHESDELGQSVFGHYFHQALLGHADGYGAGRDGRVSATELAAFVQARVERWTMHNRAASQTPKMHGNGDDFTIVSVDPSARARRARAPAGAASRWGAVGRPRPTWRFRGISLKPARLSTIDRRNLPRRTRGPDAYPQGAGLSGG